MSIRSRENGMKIEGTSALVSGGGSGLGFAAAQRLVQGGAEVVILDLPGGAAEEATASLGAAATFVPGDVTDPAAVASAVEQAEQRGAFRTLVHTAGVGGPLRIIAKDGTAGDLAVFERVIRVNMVGTFNVLRLAAVSMAKTEPVEGERGVCVLTSSISAFDGRIGQVHYASSKAGIAGMTLPAARDLSRKLIRVCTIAPGTFDTPLLGSLSDEIRAGLAADVPHPQRLGLPDEFAALAMHIIENPMLNGETIRLDGALRMTPR
jgi:NAD(P)-dependent dehydrogenase (short-subunit alcohol dehydrogenase family)